MTEYDFECPPHNIVKEYVTLDPVEAAEKGYTDAVYFWCERPECWKSKEFASDPAQKAVIDQMSHLCISVEHRHNPETHGCVDCGMGSDEARWLKQPSGITPKFREMGECPYLFTLPRDIDREIVDEFVTIYRQFVKDKLDYDIPEGGVVPGTDKWLIKFILP